MCGICGIYSLNSKNPVQKDTLDAMNESIAHRGPDDQGVYCSETIGLGHRRLSIIDLRPESAQPFHNNDLKLSLVFNGEIYNFQEIKSQLTDYSFQTDSDTEVVLAAYAKWGKECVQYFNGMFAFAIWNHTTEELFIARDRLGIKPLYYSHQSETFLFSSEIRSLLSSGLVPRKLNKEVLSEYLAYQTVHQPNTLIKDVYLLEPGHTLSIVNAEVKKAKYWDPVKVNYKEVAADQSNLKNSIKEKFYQSIERRMMADVPLGAFLSGGIDSSAIVAAMSEVGKQKPSTFSVVFDEAEYSEEKYANIVAKKFNTHHETLLLKPNDLLEEIPNALNAMDHPSGDGINTYWISKATKAAGITVALSGLGGDEIFGGYPVFKQLSSSKYLDFIKKFPFGLRKPLAPLVEKSIKGAKGQKLAMAFKAKQLNLAALYPISRQLYNESWRNKLLNNAPLALPVVSLMENLALSSEELKLGKMSSISALEISTYMQHVLLRDSDQMGMKHALEIRVPFLDHSLVEFMLSLNDEQKNGPFPKSLLVESLGDLLPREVYNRKKMGFVFPWEVWLKTNLKDFVEKRLNALKSHPSFNQQAISEVWNAFKKGDPKINWTMIWSLVVLSNWLELNKIDD